jgi:hypothetical protein
MTVDVDPPFSPLQNFVIENGVISLLDLFDQHSIKATFFVPAVIAKDFPKVANEIVDGRHEIACHGLKHHPEEGILGLNEQLRIIKAATSIIESVTGIKPIGYRAPLFRVNENCWIALRNSNYVYDSSLVGVSYTRYMKHVISLQMQPLCIKILNFAKTYNNAHLFELPVSINPILPLPLGGGWLRIFGLKWAKIGIKMNFLSKGLVVFYIHPKDIVAIQTPGLFWYNYKNTANGLKMLDNLIKYAKWCNAEFLRACELIKLFENDSLYLNLPYIL